MKLSEFFTSRHLTKIDEKEIKEDAKLRWLLYFLSYYEDKWYTSMELYQLAQKIHERVFNYFLQLTPSHLEVFLVIISPKIYRGIVTTSRRPQINVYSSSEKQGIIIIIIIKELTVPAEENLAQANFRKVIEVWRIYHGPCCWKESYHRVVGG